MKTATNSDDILLVEQATANLDTDTLEGFFAEGFVARVYRTTLVVWAVVAAMLFVNSGLPALLGLTMGTAIAVGSLRILEFTVRLFVVPGMRMNVVGAALLFNLKLPLLTVALGGAVWAAMTGIANIFALAGGIVLVQVVIVLKAMGAWLLATQTARERQQVAAGTSVVPDRRAATAPASRPVLQDDPTAA
jgi:hypothetical protein